MTITPFFHQNVTILDPILVAQGPTFHSSKPLTVFPPIQASGKYYYDYKTYGLFQQVATDRDNEYGR